MSELEDSMVKYMKQSQNADNNLTGIVDMPTIKPSRTCSKRSLYYFESRPCRISSTTIISSSQISDLDPKNQKEDQITH